MCRRIEVKQESSHGCVFCREALCDLKKGSARGVRCVSRVLRMLARQIVPSCELPRTCNEKKKIMWRSWGAPRPSLFSSASYGTGWLGTTFQALSSTFRVRGQTSLAQSFVSTSHLPSLPVILGVGEKGMKNQIRSSKVRARARANRNKRAKKCFTNRLKKKLSAADLFARKQEKEWGKSPLRK